MFQLLWKWQYTGVIGEISALRRAASVVLPPVISVYAIVAIITNIAVSIQLAVPAASVGCGLYSIVGSP